MLACRELNYTYIRRPIFTGLSFDVSSSELLILKGPNGAGKSTCLSILVGLRELQGGSIEFSVDGKPPLKWPDYRSEIGYVGAEANGSYPKLTALKNIAFWQKLYHGRIDQAECLQSLKDWGLGNRLVASHLIVERFSTGMKRRLAFARLQILKKPLWILDEPLFGLDQSAVTQFVKMLKKHLDNGGAAIMVSHDLAPFSYIDAKVVDFEV